MHLDIIYTMHLKEKWIRKNAERKVGTLRGNYIFWRPLETIEREMLCKKDELLRKDIMYLKNYKKYFSIIWLSFLNKFEISWIRELYFEEKYYS